jgi:hypothetical protein
MLTVKVSIIRQEIVGLLKKSSKINNFLIHGLYIPPVNKKEEADEGDILDAVTD